MKRLPMSTFRTVLTASLASTLLLLLIFYEHIDTPLGIRYGVAVTDGRVREASSHATTERPVAQAQRLDMSERECRVAFPEMFKDIEYGAQRGSFVLEKGDGDYKGLVQGSVRNNKLYVHTMAPDTAPQIQYQRAAILSQLYRALVTSPTTLPDTPFAFVVNDEPKNGSWTFARPNKHGSAYNVWLMPSFGFWSWPVATLGAFDEVLERIEHVERTNPWERKVDKVVWRGTPWFNSVGRPSLRQDLLKATQGKQWADVEALSKDSSSGKGNALSIEDFCAYKYVVYTEGVTYSGRLPYHQACESVLLTPPLLYLTHTAWTMRPIAADDLFAALNSTRVRRAAKNASRSLLPTVRDWRMANAVYVSPDFSDLEKLVMLLRARSDVARRIAGNQREVIVGGGYLSVAAETCYWRALVVAWAGTVAAGGGWDFEGERYETWLLRQAAGGNR